jgi:hypothetical protein
MISSLKIPSISYPELLSVSIRDKCRQLTIKRSVLYLLPTFRRLHTAVHVVEHGDQSPAIELPIHSCLIYNEFNLPLMQTWGVCK